MNKPAILVLLGLAALLATGCPTNTTGATGGGPVTARLAVTATEGDVPLTITASGVSSSSTAGAIDQYAWSIAGVLTADGPTLTHTFAAPGGYDLFLTATDSAGNTGTDAVRIRVRGSTPAEAVIVADPDTGLSPLNVAFDGTQSSSGEDTIHDYFWDFGDGETSRSSQPFHLYTADGAYLVTLRVVSGGGLEDTAELTITVGESSSGGAGRSLQFDGSQFATLPIPDGGALSACSFSTWMNASGAGGLVAALGAQELVIEADPADGEIRVRKDADTITAIASNLANQWRHLEVTYDSTAGVAIYLDGLQLKTGLLTGDLNVSTVTIGQGLTGKLARVAFWGIAQSADEVANAAVSAPSTSAAGLLGYWPVDEGSGQRLDSRTSDTDGLLGLTVSDEAADPAWSSDGP